MEWEKAVERDRRGSGKGERAEKGVGGGKRQKTSWKAREQREGSAIRLGFLAPLSLLIATESCHPSVVADYRGWFSYLIAQVVD